MFEGSGTPLRVRRVSDELRELRLRSGMGAKEVSRSLGMSMTKLSRMEHAQRGLSVDDVAALLGLYRVPAPKRSELLAMVRDGRDPNWLCVHDSRLPTNWQDLARFESEAGTIHNWENQFIPGLAQSDEYAETVIRSVTEDLSGTEVHQLVAARMSRQSVLLGSHAPTARFLLDETVVRRPLADRGVRRRQLERLLNVLSRSNVTLQIVPFSAGVHPGMEGPFVLLDFAKHRNVVYLEHRGNSAFLEQPEHVVATRTALRRLRELALPHDDSVRLISEVANALS